MKTSLLAGVLLLGGSSLFAKCGMPGGGHEPGGAGMPQVRQASSPADNTRVQVALLLDTSNSMDGLIDQAKSRLWNIINTLTTLKYKGKTPVVEIALYEYGNDGLAAEGNFIRQVTPLTTDLDLISEKLFSLRTNGGSEYCGAVIREAVKKLEWGHNEADMKLIYIAGNEPFSQGGISYKEAVAAALGRNIFVNTIFCGNKSEGVETFWKDGADRGKGKYFNIDPDQKVRFIETPYDARIHACNEKMNRTYIGYGAMGVSKKQNQELQDKNAGSISRSNYAERAVSKSKAVYKNDSWDLVDRLQEDKEALNRLKKDELPQELRDKDKAEIEKIVAAKSKERAQIRKELEELGRQRQAYIDAEQKKANVADDDLGAAINTSLVSLAGSLGYTVEK